MIFAIPTQENAISELQIEIKAAKKSKWYRRLRIIQRSQAGVSVAQLAEQFDICQATVRSYIKAYNLRGIDTLKAKTSPGRPPKIGHLTRDDWQQILQQTPNQYEKLATDSRQWTLDLLVGYAKAYLCEEVCFQTVSQALRRCKYRTGRSKLRVGSPDPDYRVKRERIETLRSL